MKSRPTCNRTYPDDNLAFCLMDGSVLSAPYDPAETRAAPRRSNEPPPTEVISAPAKPAETRGSLQSTIRAPVPEIPALHRTEKTTVVPETSRATSSLFRWAIGARGAIAIACAIYACVGLYLHLKFPLVPSNRYGWYIWMSTFFGGLSTLYPFFGGLVTLAAGVKAYLDYRAGKLLLLDGVIGCIVGVVAGILFSQQDSNYYRWAPFWPVLTGFLQIGAAIGLRKHVSRTLLLGLAGGASILYGALLYSMFFTSLSFEWLDQARPLFALGIFALFIALVIGPLTIVFALLTRSKHSSAA